MRPANVSVHIEELVLHGVAPGDRHRVAAALQAEMTRLFTAAGAPAALLRSTAVPRLDGGAIPAAPSSRPEVVGTQVAGAIYGAWSKP